MRSCTQCPFKSENIDDFAVKSSIDTGLCKPCKAAMNRSWYERNKEKHKADVTLNNQRYKEEEIAGLRQKRKQTSNQGYKLRARARAIELNLCSKCFIRPKNADLSICDVCIDRKVSRNGKRRADRQERQYVAKHIVADAKETDRKKGRPNDLTVEFVECLIANGCLYCGSTELRMTVDRIDNALGHTQDNVNPSCIRCNYSRGAMPYAAWECLLEGIRAAHNKGLFGSWTGRARVKK